MKISSAFATLRASKPLQPSLRLSTHITMPTLGADSADATSGASTPHAESSQGYSSTQSAPAGLKRAQPGSSVHGFPSSSCPVSKQPTPPATSRACSYPQPSQYKVIKKKAKHAQQSSTKAIVTRSMVYFDGLPDASPHKSTLSKGGMASHIATDSSQQSTTNATVTRDMFQPQGLPSDIRI
jgi:hypothetical protein